jgi:hypothetical protein
VIVHSNKPREWKALAAASGVYATKATSDGKDYYRLILNGNKDGVDGLAFYQPDDKTLIAASEATLRRIMAGQSANGDAPKWRKGMRRSIPGHAAMAIDMAWARGQATALLKANSDVAPFLAMASPLSPLWEKVDGLVVAFDGTGGLTISSENVCGDESSARMVEKTIDAVLTLAQNASGEVPRLLREEVKDQPSLGRLVDLAEQGVKSARVERDDAVVRVRTTVKGDLVQAIRAVAEAK